MDWDDSEPQKTAKAAAVGDRLDDLSIEDLKQRISEMRNEIARLEVEIKARQVQKDAASSIFKS